MLIDKTIIEKFLNNHCNAEEAKQVYQFLQEHPEVLQEMYRQDWFQASEEGPVNSYFSEDMYRQITSRLQVRKPVIRVPAPWMAAAAVVISIALCMWMYLSTGKQTGAVEQVAESKKVEKEKTVQQPWLQHKNNSGTKESFRLPDGSIVMLTPSASLKFKPGFDPDKRDLFLEGEAYFEVAKDKARPFTVYTGGLSTTALGTSFRITTKPTTIKVQLITGKVVVRAVKKSLPGWKRDVYLLPGQQMNYDSESSLVNVSGPAEVNKEKVEIITSAPVQPASEQMVFDNTPLSEVFEKLSKHHKVSITYSAEDLNGLGFTGTIFYKDSLPVILQAIARMNDLLLTNVPDGYFIKKLIKE